NNRQARAADAVVRPDPDAARPPVPGRRRRPHRPADRRQGSQPRRRRRRPARSGRGRPRSQGRPPARRRLLRYCTPARLAVYPLLVVDDHNVASGSGPVRRAAAALPAALGHLERGSRGGSGGELRGSAHRLLELARYRTSARYSACVGWHNLHELTALRASQPGVTRTLITVRSISSSILKCESEHIAARSISPSIRHRVPCSPGPSADAERATTRRVLCETEWKA